jgi:hypothetical protein
MWRSHVCLSVCLSCLTYCQQLNDVSDFHKLLLQSFMRMCSTPVILHLMAQMNFYPYSPYFFTEWVRLRIGVPHVMLSSHFEFRHNQCTESHTLLVNVNNPLPLFSTILILFGRNSVQMSTIHCVAVSFVKMCAVKVTLHLRA